MHSWPTPIIPDLEGSGPTLRLYDTADRQIRPVAAGQTATMYVCGITPYDATHLGHAATYVTFDLIYRLWRDAGHHVCYVQNITDIDDPLLERAHRDGLDWNDLARSQIELFRTDMTALKVLPPTHYVSVTEVIDDIAGLIEEMLHNNYAYILHGDYPDIYFRTDSTPQFGYESGYSLQTMLELSRQRGGDPDRPGKHHPLDPLLWRAQRPGEPSWNASFGPGRPGWHVECAAILRKYIPGCVDIQGGGSDLIFPHHEFSSAHLEAITHSPRCARHYVHAGMIGYEGQKMSKSLGNLVFVSQLHQQGIPSAAIRLGLLSEHYRTDRYWTSQVLTDAQQRLHRWQMAMTQPAGPDAHDTIRRIRRYLADDLDTPHAIAAIDGWVTNTLEYGGHDSHAPTLMATAIDALLGISFS